jgi:hypothetical protein
MISPAFHSEDDACQPGLLRRYSPLMCGATRMMSSESDSVPSDEDREEPRVVAVTADDSVQRRMSSCEFS